jgi:hypothetical protein
MNKERMRRDHADDECDGDQGDNRLFSELEVFTRLGCNILCQCVPIKTDVNDCRNKEYQRTYVVDSHQEMLKYTRLSVGSAQMQWNASARLCIDSPAGSLMMITLLWVRVVQLNARRTRCCEKLAEPTAIIKTTI